MEEIAVFHYTGLPSMVCFTLKNMKKKKSKTTICYCLVGRSVSSRSKNIFLKREGGGSNHKID